MIIARNKPLFLELLSLQFKWPFCGNWNGCSLPRISPSLREADDVSVCLFISFIYVLFTWYNKKPDTVETLYNVVLGTGKCCLLYQVVCCISTQKTNNLCYWDWTIFFYYIRYFVISDLIISSFHCITNHFHSPKIPVIVRFHCT